ncbi:hypothetical protein QTJ16_002238 [Diplocarpon rosae]|uniref:F-box domain-containing protein n=1 Tax=Diplocarpon rosae TaxID=946125 RepID=A0AAD9T6E7_9HELO|nr:hypothetical protein QTJ16_002238 [Diplocarpon rosae]
MASPFHAMNPESQRFVASPVEHSEAIQIGQPRLKGRAKLLRGLQRISSSPSLAQLGRRRATSIPYSGRAALSCVSLAAGSAPRNYDNSYSSQSTAGASTAPTTPGLEGPSCDDRIRRIEYSTATPGTSSPTSTLPLDIRPQSSRGPHAVIPEILEDYFSLPVVKEPIRRENFDFWGMMPHEVKLAIFAYFKPRELVRASNVSKLFHKTCFDGQLWTCFDASEFYKEIPAESLARIIVRAGPFVKDINLRGCVQVEHYKRAEIVVKACRNLVSATLEGCKNIHKSTLHSLLRTNERLANLNLTGLPAVTNATCRIIARSCPSLEMFNVSWCTHMDARGVQAVIAGCPKLNDLRAGEVRGFHNLDVAQLIFETNNLQRLVLSGCVDLSNEALQTMLTGKDPEVDILTDIAIVPVRRLRHLDLSRCCSLTSTGVKTLAHLVPALEGLQLSACPALTDNALSGVLATTPRLTLLELEELPELTNTLFSNHLARASCAATLEHLSVSYCEDLGDPGLLPVIRACTSLRSIDMDNTKISDLVLAEAASMIRARSARTTCTVSRPRVSLVMVMFDCSNVTWTGIREVMSLNSEVRQLTGSQVGATYPTEVIRMRCFYGWQPTVDEHLRRVLIGDLAAAGRLERLWTEHMRRNEEVDAAGGNVRRRRRRQRVAQMMHADEEEGGVGMGGIGRRRRARSNGCAIM